MENEANRLRRENKELRVKLQGLLYENSMYKQLLDNVFLGGNEGIATELVTRSSEIQR